MHPDRSSTPFLRAPINSEARVSFLYLLATLASTAGLALLVGQSGVDQGWLRLGVLFPSLLALVFVSAGSIPTGFGNQFLLSRASLPWLAASALFFFVLALGAGPVASLFSGTAPAPLGRAPDLDRVLFLVFLSLGEEVGWRGFALPLLAVRFGWIRSSLIVGVVWWIWHLPGWTLGFGAPTDVSIFVFGLWVVSASVVFTLFYLRSGRSVWTAVILHASANVAFQVVPVMPSPAGSTAPFYTLALATSGLAILAGVWIHAGALEDRDQHVAGEA